VCPETFDALPVWASIRFRWFYFVLKTYVPLSPVEGPGAKKIDGPFPYICYLLLPLYKCAVDI
jgi:hypothetical protein